jgi:acetyltransferase-like isoleucine patch superfamily enzyme
MEFAESVITFGSDPKRISMLVVWWSKITSAGDRALRFWASAHTGVPTDAPILTTPLVIKPVVVGFGADIGMNASILPGMHVGAHSIVGAGAVVTHDIPDYAIVAGLPARLSKV